MNAGMDVCTLRSTALGRVAEFVVYRPSTPSGPLPTLYLLHGATGNHLDWSTHAHDALTELSERHRLIIVNPDGGEYGWYLDSVIVPENRYESFMIHELLPHIESSLGGSDVRSVAGLSMGGHGAITLAWKHAGLFSSVSSMSGVVDLTRCRIKDSLTRLLGPYEAEPEVWHGHSSWHLVEQEPHRLAGTPLRVSCGASDYYFSSNQDFSKRLTAFGLDHIFEASPGDHSWDYWTDQLARHLDWHAAYISA